MESMGEVVEYDFPRSEMSSVVQPQLGILSTGPAPSPPAPTPTPPPPPEPSKLGEESEDMMEKFGYDTPRRARIVLPASQSSQISTMTQYQAGCRARRSASATLAKTKLTSQDSPAAAPPPPPPPPPQADRRGRAPRMGPIMLMLMMLACAAAGSSTDAASTT